MAATIGAALIAPRLAQAQGKPGPVAPPSVITQPPRDFSPNGAPTTYFTDPDVLTVDPSFDGLRQPNAAIQRLWTGALWSEGPAWSSEGKYLVWSDIPNNASCAMEDDGHVSVFRAPSNNSNQHPSTTKAASCLASTSGDAWCAMSSTARQRSLHRCSAASA
jgi:gluconolactonase